MSRPRWASVRRGRPDERRSGAARLGVSVPGGRAAVPGVGGAGGRRGPGRGGRSGPHRRGVRSPRPACRSAPRQDSAAKDLDMLAARGGRLVTPEDDEWPLSGIHRVRWWRRCARSRAAHRRWCCGRWDRRGSTTSRNGRRQSWVPGQRPPTANTWRRISRPAWSSATSRWCPAAHSGLTARLTARRWPPTASRSPCWPAASTFLIRLGIPRCCTGYRPPGCWSPSTRRVCGRRDTGS